MVGVSHFSEMCSGAVFPIESSALILLDFFRRSACFEDTRGQLIAAGFQVIVIARVALRSLIELRIGLSLAHRDQTTIDSC